ncbi:terpenoid synthase [Artomyces pyxidatus]|uniref:Terpenoid synthase n=1 Tax=Artomyces pyxidatus TaxID=48021 RepID=A0ACB8T379_9AGAM|nr:terpenoid synthase [Artomyces pyxidatus]
MHQKFYIPNCLENWKWPRALNPHYPEVKAESAAWARSFGAFSPKAQDAYDRCDFNLLACLGLPLLDKARMRSGCDLMNTFFVFDEYSDVAPAEEVQIQADIIMDALRNPHTPRPKGEWVGGEITRQFWELTIKTASPQSQKRFIQTFETYTQSVVQEAADREHHHVRNIQEYLEVRRETIGAKPSFVFLELDMDLPDEAVEHPVIQEMSILAVDMISVGNDIASYNVEQARGGDNHNIVTIVMNQEKTDIQGAMDWVVRYHKTIEDRFMELYEQVPKFGEPVDSQLAIYVDGLGNWVRACDQWSFESGRYFGKKAPEIQKTRWVTLMPKERAKEVGPLVVDESIL